MPYKFSDFAIFPHMAGMRLADALFVRGTDISMAVQPIVVKFCMMVHTGSGRLFVFNRDKVRYCSKICDFFQTSST